MPLQRVCILHHPKIAASHPLASEIDQWLRQRGIETWLESSWNSRLVTEKLGDTDLLIALGGDGTLLRAGRAAAQFDVPILGINLGRLGFLAEIDPGAWIEQLPRVVAGDYWLEKRLMLRVEAWRGDVQLDQAYDALNEAVVSRGGLARVVRISADINDGFLTTYVADGAIVSSPTGSTAYALAAGGPILPPELQNMLLLPIAPHLSMGRPIVLDRGAIVTLRVQTDHGAMLTVDGQFLIDLADGDRVVVTSSPHVASFVRLQQRSYFYRSLLERLRLTV